MKRIMRTTKLLFLLTFSVVGVAVAGEGSVVAPESNALAIDTMWMLLAAFMVFFMQAGFAMVETGFTRAKNACNIIMKNLMDFSIGSLAYWAIGFAIMFGATRSGLFGSNGFFLSGGDPSTHEGLWQIAFWLFQAVFAATAATIVSGAMAERTRFVGYLCCSAVITGIIYPVSGHWIWGDGGWLAEMGMEDFAGSTVVHSVGGWAALMGALILGPRIGKYAEHGGKKISKALIGHNIPLASLGVFILWFGWFGFNAGSTTAGTDLSIGTIAVNTNLAAAAGAMTAMFTIWSIVRKPDASMSLNGALAGLVAITAPCAVVSPTGAVVIGAIAGALVVLSVLFIDQTLHIDDPVGAVSVHGVCGLFGTLAVGLFAHPAYSGGAITGLFYGGGLDQFGVQLLGAVSVMAWVLVASGAMFFVIRHTVGLRVSKDEELRGLDIGEHGMEAYGGFQIFTIQ